MERSGKRKSARRALVIMGALFIIVSVVIPIVLKVWITHTINNITSDRLKYQDIEVSLLDGAFALLNVSQTGKDGSLHAGRVEYSIDARALSFGRVRANATFRNLEIKLKGTGIATSFINPFEDLSARLVHIPLSKINVENGTLHFEGKGANRNEALVINNINVIAQNLDHFPEPKGNALVAKADGFADVYGGKLAFHLDFDPTSRCAAFDLTATMKKLDLGYLAGYLSNYGTFAVEKGILSVVAQATAEDREVSGFVKSILETIQLVQHSNHPSELLTPEALVDNPFAKPLPQMAFREDLKQNSSSMWCAVAVTLRNALFEALIPVVNKARNRKERHHPEITKAPTAKERQS